MVVFTALKKSFDWRLYRKYLLINFRKSSVYSTIIAEMFMARRYWLTSGLGCLFLTGCFSGNSSQAPGPDAGIDSSLRNLIAAHSLSGDGAIGRNIPSIESPTAQLGKALFFTKALSGTLDTACASCHHPVLGGGDDLVLPIGVHAEIPELLGPGRQHSPSGDHFDGGPTVPRNSPTTFNIALWDQTIFHDGRLQSLQPIIGNNGQGTPIRTPDTVFGSADPLAGDNLSAAQSRFPVTSPEEMLGFTFAELDNPGIRDMLTERLRGVRNLELSTNQWPAAFALAFGDESQDPDSVITFARVTQAIADYERSQVFVANPWRDYVQGNDNAISAAAKRGALVFFNAPQDGGAGCASCHSGDFFTDESFHVLAVPQIGRGKGDGSTGSDDFGRYRETGVEDDRYAFRTPSLLNVAVTGPWGHSGAYTRLADMVQHHANPELAVQNYDVNKLAAGVQTQHLVENSQAALAQLERLRNSGTSMLPDVALTEDQIADLVAFMESLTDPCVLDRECLSPWIPDENTPNPDGLRLDAVDQAGNRL
jgi:cytochrome c peroxidase